MFELVVGQHNSIRVASHECSDIDIMTLLSSDAADRWEHFLDPEVLRPFLFLATMFITTFEILQDSIFDDLRGFMRVGSKTMGRALIPNIN